MDALLLCDYCNHGVPLHDGSGCSATRCPCTSTREAIVGRILALTKEEIHNAYRQI